VQPNLEDQKYIVGRHLKPEARRDMIETFRKSDLKPTAMIDISDGLASEIFHICKQSNKGCKIFEDKLPIDQKTYDLAREFNLDPTVCAMSGGEDYELLFTIPVTDYEKIKTEADISIIGHITETPDKVMIDKSGNSITLRAQGWDGLKDL
jgi:thiamine-monophosphate kinase